MYGGREALPDDHKFRGQRGRVRARYRRPQPGRGTEKTGETSQRKTNLQLASGAFSCKVAPFTPAGERTKKAPSRGGRTGSNGQQHPVVIDCEVLRKRRSRCTTPGELRATRKLVRFQRVAVRKHVGDHHAGVVLINALQFAESTRSVRDTHHRNSLASNGLLKKSVRRPKAYSTGTNIRIPDGGIRHENVTFRGRRGPDCAAPVHAEHNEI